LIDDLLSMYFAAPTGRAGEATTITPILRGDDRRISEVATHLSIPQEIVMEPDRETRMIEICRIRERRGYRECVHDEALEGLSGSLHTDGQIHPILVYSEGDGFGVITGNRTLNAARLARLTHVLCTIDNRPLSNADRLHQCIISDTHRKGLKPMELAECMKDLMELRRWNARQLGEALHYSDATVSRLLPLNYLPEHIKARVRSGELSASAAYALARAEDTDFQTDLADVAVKERLNREEIRRRAGVATPSGKRRGRKPTPKLVFELESGGTITALGHEMDSLESIIQSLDDMAARLRRAVAAGLDLAALQGAAARVPRAGQLSRA
jgi:ParB/RepB/Spo0J family partition protein